MVITFTPILKPKLWLLTRGNDNKKSHKSNRLQSPAGRRTRRTKRCGGRAQNRHLRWLLEIICFVLRTRRDEAPPITCRSNCQKTPPLSLLAQADWCFFVFTPGRFSGWTRTNISGVCCVEGRTDRGTNSPSCLDRVTPGERQQQPDRLHGPASIGRLRRLSAGENKVEHFHGDKVTVAALIYLRQRPKERTPRGH